MNTQATHVFRGDFWATDRAAERVKWAVYYRNTARMCAGFPGMVRSLRDQMRNEARDAVRAARRYRAERSSL